MTRATSLFGAQLSVIVLAAAASGAAQQSSMTPRPAVPVEPIAAIVDAFQSHSVVALSDAHGNAQAHAFLLSLVRDPRFADTANDIVVEFGNARYQDLVDRFVRGEDVPPESLRPVWRNTTQVTAHNEPLAEEVLQTVRMLNASRPRERQLRVLLGEPPIDWDRVRTREDFLKWLNMREAYPAALLQLEVLARERRALLVYGAMHFQRKNLRSNYDMSVWPAQTIVSLLEAALPYRVFTIFRAGAGFDDLQPDISSWRVPSLAVIKGTTLGDVDFARYYSATPPRTMMRFGKPALVPREEWKTLRAEDQFDAILYLGPPSAMTEIALPPSVCAEPGYLDTRLARIALTGVPQFEADRLKEYCEKAAPK